MEQTIKLSLPGHPYKVEVRTVEKDNRLFLHFGFNKKMIEEIKCMEGYKWHGVDGGPKVWSIKKSTRNMFTLDFMQGKNVYANYDKPLINVDFVKYDCHKQKPYEHQKDFVRHILTRRQCVIAGEMGTGKTRAAGMAMELSGISDWWWIGTKASIKAVEYDFRKWGFKVIPKFMTYEQLVRTIATWESGTKAPRGLIIDESSRAKTPDAKRSLACHYLAECMRAEHGTENVFVVLMSGSPAPKSPEDWWMQCEIACPGFIREGNITSFRNRLCLVKKFEGGAGNFYHKIATWWDDENKCKKCGEHKNDPVHNLGDPLNFNACYFEKSFNEVAHLYKRLNGLVMIKFKKDCLKDLPEKQFERIICTPSASTLRVLKSTCRTARSAAQALILAREISDGFLYTETKSGERKPCDVCKGTRTMVEWYDPSNPDAIVLEQPNDAAFLERKAECRYCTDGSVDVYETSTREVSCPKEDALVDLLERHDECGRIVVYAGFQASIDRCVRVCQREGWYVIRVDGRGWQITDPHGNLVEEKDALRMFQDMQATYEKVAFVGHPGSAGMGLTLTASPGIVYYSNDFNAENRIQSMDRIHRPGMDVTRGAWIYDLIHLPTDEYILDNLQKKFDLQAITMGDFSKILDSCTERVV